MLSCGPAISCCHWRAERRPKGNPTMGYANADDRILHHLGRRTHLPYKQNSYGLGIWSLYEVM